MLVMVGLLKVGSILSLFDHMAEGMENSNHGVNKFYHRSSMRDGGSYNLSTSSEFDDLFCSFIKVLVLHEERMIKECKADPEETPQITCSFLDRVMKRSQTQSPNGEVNEKVFMDEYLKICQVPIPKNLPLNMDNTGEQTLLGMKFYVTGSLSILKLKPTNGGKSGKVTQSMFKELIRGMGGDVLSDGVFFNICDNTTVAQQLGHSYVTLQDDQLYKDYLKPGKTDPKAFTAATRCDFKFIKAQFIIDCYTAGRLIDPETMENNSYKYVFTFETDSFVKNNRSCVSKKVEMQRMPDPASGEKRSLAKSRFKQNLKKAKSIQDKYAKTPNMYKRGTVASYKRGTVASLLLKLSKCSSSVSRGAWEIFRHNYLQHVTAHEEKAGLRRNAISVQSSCTGSHWRSTTAAEKQKWQHIAAVLMGKIPADGGEYERLQELGASLEFTEALDFTKALEFPKAASPDGL